MTILMKDIEPTLYSNFNNIYFFACQDRISRVVIFVQTSNIHYRSLLNETGGGDALEKILAGFFV